MWRHRDANDDKNGPTLARFLTGLSYVVFWALRATLNSNSEDYDHDFGSFYPSHWFLGQMRWPALSAVCYFMWWYISVLCCIWCKSFLNATLHYILPSISPLLVLVFADTSCIDTVIFVWINHDAKKWQPCHVFVQLLFLLHPTLPMSLHRYTIQDDAPTHTCSFFTVFSWNFKQMYCTR